MNDGPDEFVESCGVAVGLHVTEAARAGATAGLDVGELAGTVLRRAGVDDGQPFVLGPDGSYDVELNRFFRELDEWGVRAANSVAAYARDVMLFCRFLDVSRGGKTIWECDGADLRCYKSVRLHSVGDQQVSVATWRRSVAALDKWAAWALHEGLVTATPFRYLDKTVLTPQGMKRVRVNTLQEPRGQGEPIRFLPFEDYLLWRDVGLRGELPDGRADPGWRGRHPERNAMFADLLVHTGMRLVEGASLLVAEVPAASGGPGAVHLSAAVTKRNKGRTVFVNGRTLAGLHRYINIERDELITRRMAAGAYRDGERTLSVRRAGSAGLTVAGERGSWSYSKIGVRLRRDLMAVTDDGELAGPLWLWLGDDGQPLACSTWQSAFHRANQRCARFDLDVTVTPHILRHSFAVHMLGLLLRQTVRALGMQTDRRFTHAQVKRLLIGNPMRKLQLLLGHSHEETVYVYLDVLDEAQEIVASALDEWDLQAAAFDKAGSDGDVDGGER
ncbi:MAG: tyrosine-type recombinase/integrase [Actinomycetota bacterium]|nr:tyrosine-type recombinase/integrase [Actinomycetota bacterium]